MRATPFRPFVVAAAVTALLSVPMLRADVFYVPDIAGDTITRVNSAGVKTPVVTAGLSTPKDVAFDAAGNLYVADSGLGNVLKFPAGGGAPTVVGNSVPGVCSLAFTANGDLYVLSQPDDTIKKLVENSFQTFATLTDNQNATPVVPQSMRISSTGEIYVADSGNRVFEVAENGNADVFSRDVVAPFAVAIDGAGKPYVTDTKSGGRIANFTGGNAANNAKDVITGLGSVRGLAFDKGNIAHYLTGTGELRKVTGRNSTELLANGLGDPQLLTSRGATTTVIAYKGQSISEPASAVFSTLGSPAIGGGFVAFKASLLPPSGSVSSANALGIWRADASGALELLARKNFPLPNNNDLVMNTFGDPVINEAGEVAFIGTLRSGLPGVTSANALGIFSDVGGQPLRPIVRRGALPPGPDIDSEVKFTAFKQIVLPNDSGPAVIATIAGPGVNLSNNIGLWSADSAGTLSLVARKGDMITVGGASRKLTKIGIFTPTKYSLGQSRHFGDGQKFTFLATFSDGFTAILRANPGGAPTVVAEKLGDVGTDLPGGKFAKFGSPAMNAAGDKAGFLSKLVPGPGGVTTASATAIFVQTTENDLIAQNTFSAPDVTGGTLTGGIFGALFDPVMSTSGGTAFLGKLRVNQDIPLGTTAGLWQDLGTGLKLAVRQRDPVPGVAGNAVFTAFKQFALPGIGGVVFTSTIAGSGVSLANNLGLWANDGAGGTELLIRKGDKMQIGGNQKTVTAFKVFTKSLGVSGQSRHFDDQGSVTCHVKCSDGTQAILLIQRP